jgi:hypothetical protein
VKIRIVDKVRGGGFFPSEMRPGGGQDVQGEGVITSRDAGMIGEFCPKVFALKDASGFRLKAVVVESGAEASAGSVTGCGMSAFSTAGGGHGPLR